MEDVQNNVVACGNYKIYNQEYLYKKRKNSSKEKYIKRGKTFQSSFRQKKMNECFKSIKHIVIRYNNEIRLANKIYNIYKNRSITIIHYVIIHN
jgi:hypothetical protein